MAETWEAIGDRVHPTPQPPIEAIGRPGTPGMEGASAEFSEGVLIAKEARPLWQVTSPVP